MDNYTPDYSSPTAKATPFKLTSTNPSGWRCYLFGGSHTSGIIYQPEIGKVPNYFVRWMMKIFFDCTWVKDKS